MQIISRKDAKISGLTRFFTGKPCPHGHIDETWVASKTCITCGRASSKLYGQRHRDRKLAYYAAHADEIRHKARLKMAEYRAAHPDKHKEQHKRHRDSEKGKATRKAWRAAHKEIVDSGYRNRYAKRKSANGTHTAKDTASIMIAQGNRCAYCRILLRKHKHLDHIIPLASGGSNWPTNLQWLCVSCNSHKHTKDPIVFAQSMGMLL